MTRKSPFKHKVKTHYRTTSTGKKIRVTEYRRGEGKPTPHKTVREAVGRRLHFQLKDVKRIHSERSKTAQSIDNSKRAPFTYDYNKWVHEPNQYDVSGVDSPGGFSKVENIDTSNYTNASLSGDRIGGIYRVNVWNKNGEVTWDKFGFKTKEEAMELIEKIKTHNQKNVLPVPPFKDGEEINKIGGTIPVRVKDLGKQGLYAKTPLGLEPITNWLQGDQKKQYLEYKYKTDIYNLNQDIEEAKKEGNKPKVDVLLRDKEKIKATYEEDVSKIKNDTQKTGAESTYNIATGWLRIVFDEKPDRDTLDKLKKQGFRYNPRSRAWTAKYGYGREETLREISGKVDEVNIPINYEGKAEYYEQKAIRAKREADEKYNKAKKLMEFIPIGQPILVGHHSEKKHRRDLDKIDRDMKKSFEIGDKAKQYAETAERMRDKAEGTENPLTVKNRIKNLEKDIKRLERYALDESGEEKARTEKQINRLQSLLHQQEQQYKRTGGVLADVVDFKPGMIVHTTNGKARIKKVSGKSVRVELITDARSLQGPPWNNLKIDKDKILKVYE